MDVLQHSTTKEASAVSARVAYELSLLSHPSLCSHHRFSVKWATRTLKFLHRDPMLRMDGQEFGEANISVSGICQPSCFVSPDLDRSDL